MIMFEQPIQTTNSEGWVNNSPFTTNVRSRLLDYIDQQLAIVRESTNEALESQIVSRLSALIKEVYDQEVANENIGWKFVNYSSNHNQSRQFCLSKLSDVLRNDEGDYDDEFLIPSDISISKMEDFIHFIYGKFNSNEIGQASFSPDGNGGIEATWKLNSRYLQIIIPSNKEPYLFYKQKSDFKIEQFSHTYELNKWFSWLIQENI